ncbi:hypothetical protein AAZX31_20G195600 [Glycine max]|uniref:Uncharacterized protein n=2 Tax=Glycine subgen. Soja TaxID=1462606 RepID=K7N4T0_SOYBN|nr:protein ALTERED PHOSPHATE STARVATION RESPONSE 1 [Glycine max]XP_028220685.1 leiomodin-2-like [Glycine soja]KAG4908372.1 hypothetical protein JHK86_056856 [Glycine max]KAG4911015.1 hypothetical protein JHK87_057131 [Glycine soja]KAG4919596.1 hypothetical protein JHK85_057877 [Glycine max]KAG5075684.1 hypothetical protein JHK84_056915 [Glycine max]KAG5078328.1 hypothetical protein JHK82_057023 [Glycine max]|eukprot:XP_006606390.1 leiomodin-2 [Glycine max]
MNGDPVASSPTPRCAGRKTSTSSLWSTTFASSKKSPPTASPEKPPPPPPPCAERITNLLPPPPSSISRSESLVIMWVRSRSRFGSVVWRYLTATFL